jgi:hypothetical protein
MIVAMKFIATFVAVLCALWPLAARATPVGYSITIITAFAHGNPFPNRLDNAYTQPETGYLQIANSGGSTFSGAIGTIALSAFAGDMSYLSGPVVLAPGATVSIAIPYDSSSVGGFNGPHYFYRPGVEIYLDGTMSRGTDAQTVNLRVADRDIHSGVWRTDSYGLASDSFVLQGGDPWGFDTSNAYALSLAHGVYVFSQAVPEPGTLGTLAAALAALGSVRWVAKRRFRPRRA